MRHVVDDSLIAQRMQLFQVCIDELLFDLPFVATNVCSLASEVQRMLRSGCEHSGRLLRASGYVPTLFHLSFQ